MRRGRLTGRLGRLEANARRKNDPKARYLRDLLAFIGLAREARQTGDEEKTKEAAAIRDSLEERARVLE